MALPATQPDLRVSVSEYLGREAKAIDRHEYHDGEVLVMSGGTARHSRITTNLTSLLNPVLANTPCQVFDSNMRVAIRATKRYVYPDASIVCGRVEFDIDDPNQTTVTNARVIFEVLSESTEGYDRGEKFEHYQHSPTVEEYVLIAQDRTRVDSILRQPDGSWNWVAYGGLDAVARVRCVGIDLPLAELYARVELPAATAAEADSATGGEG